MNLKLVLGLYVCFTFLVFKISFAQQFHQVDSLVKQLALQKEDTAKITLYHSIYELLVPLDPKKALDYANQMLHESLALNYEYGIAQAYACLAHCSYLSSDHQKAIKYSFESLKNFEGLNRFRDVGDLYNLLGKIFCAMSNYKKSLQYYMLSLEFRLKYGDKLDVANNYENIGNTYYRLGDLKSATHYQLKNLELSFKINREPGIASALYSLGRIHEDNTKYNQALDYYLRSLPKYLELGKNQAAITCFYRIGSIHQELTDYKKAIHFFKKVIEYSDGDPTFNNIYSHEKIILCHQKLNDPEAALSYFDAYNKLKETHYDEIVNKQAIEIEAKYEQSKYESELEIQHLKTIRKNYWIAGIILCFLVIGSLGYMFFRHSKLELVNKMLDLERRLLLSQMNPHFIFNSLTAIQGFVFEKDTKTVNEFLGKFARLMRLTLEDTRQSYVTLEREVETLNYYIELQSIRYENQFKYSINIDPEVELPTTLIPPMILQPFIENSIEHGFIDKKITGYLEINFKKENHNTILIEIIDNGIGIVESRKRKANHLLIKTSLGTEIIKERLRLLRKTSKLKIRVSIVDMGVETQEMLGTKVEVRIPQIQAA